MKANRRYTEKTVLDFMGEQINSNKCCNIEIKFTIDARHILMAINYFPEELRPKLTRKEVEDRLKKELSYYGETYSTPIETGDEGNHYGLKQNLTQCLEIGRRLFPEFFGVPNSIDFFTKEKG